MLAKKEIVLGVSGSISSYKSVEILRELSRLKACVTVVMTKNAVEFISPLTFQILSKQKTITGLFEAHQEFQPEHIALSRKADFLLVAPATANIIGKFASGIADDFLSSLFLSMRAPILLAPAMNPTMYLNPFVQRNLSLLKKNNIEIIEPGVGEVACGESGQGRLAAVEDIVERVIQKLRRESSLQKHNIIITAGPTREYLDPIRYLSNRSSGKMGFALAKVAYQRGAHVTLISGPTNLSPYSPHINYIPVVTTEEMRQAVEHHFPQSTIVIMAAAVCDWQPLHPASSKIEKHTLPADFFKLQNTPDILEFLGQEKKGQIIVGFAAETTNVLEKAKGKLRTKNLDLICVNDITQEGAGFDVDTNKVSLIDIQHNVIHFPLMTKEKVAEKILDKVETLVKK